MAAELAALLLLLLLLRPLSLLFSLLLFTRREHVHALPASRNRLAQAHESEEEKSHKDSSWKNCSFQSLAPPPALITSFAAGLFSATGPPPPPRVGRAARCELLARLARAAARFRVIAVAKKKKTRASTTRFFEFFSFVDSALGANKKFPSGSHIAVCSSRSRFRAFTQCGPASEEAPLRHRCQHRQIRPSSAG